MNKELLLWLAVLLLVSTSAAQQQNETDWNGQILKDLMHKIVPNQAAREACLGRFEGIKGIERFCFCIGTETPIDANTVQKASAQNLCRKSILNVFPIRGQELCFRVGSEVDFYAEYIEEYKWCKDMIYAGYLPYRGGVPTYSRGCGELSVRKTQRAYCRNTLVTIGSYYKYIDSTAFDYAKVYFKRRQVGLIPFLSVNVRGYVNPPPFGGVGLRLCQLLYPEDPQQCCAYSQTGRIKRISKNYGGAGGRNLFDTVCYQKGAQLTFNPKVAMLQSEINAIDDGSSSKYRFCMGLFRNAAAYGPGDGAALPTCYAFVDSYKAVGETGEVTFHKQKDKFPSLELSDAVVADMCQNSLFPDGKFAGIDVSGNIGQRVSGVCNLPEVGSESAPLSNRQCCCLLRNMFELKRFPSICR